MITLTLLDGNKLHTREIDGYRRPNQEIGDNPKAHMMVHTLGSWYGVLESLGQIESLTR